MVFFVIKFSANYELAPAKSSEPPQVSAQKSLPKFLFNRLYSTVELRRSGVFRTRL